MGASRDGSDDAIALVVDDSPHFRCKIPLLHHKLALEALQVIRNSDVRVVQQLGLERLEVDSALSSRDLRPPAGRGARC